MMATNIHNQIIRKYCKIAGEPPRAEHGEAAEAEPARPDDEMALQVQACPNTVEEHSHSFTYDMLADNWESEQVDGVTPQMVQEAKRAELVQLYARKTFEVCPRESVNIEKTVGTKWVITNKGSIANRKSKPDWLPRSVPIRKHLSSFRALRVCRR